MSLPLLVALIASQAQSPARVLKEAERTLGDKTFVNLNRQEQARAVDAGKSLAPYLVVVGEGGDTEPLPLKSTRAEVHVAGPVAQVKVKQTFENTRRKPIDAKYVFPASTRAAVHGMRMRIGERTIEAHIDKKQAARAAYEAARQNGQRAALLEQERPNVFVQEVANLMPGERIDIELDYSEFLVPEEGTYEFVYPTVVGPRYTGGANPRTDGWMANPHLAQGNPEPYAFGFDMTLNSGIPLKEVSSPSHKLQVTYDSTTSARLSLAQTGGGNKDVVVRYRLAGNAVEAGVMLFEGKDGNYFALQVEPPARPLDGQIPSREYIFLLDVSGSMHGFPLETAKTVMRNLASRLRPTDTFNIVLFAGTASVVSPEGSMPATQANVAQALERMNRERGGGGTELLDGLRRSFGIPRRDERAARTVVVVTDGYVGVENQTFKFIREHLSEASVYAFGIGSSVNRFLIEGMARAGQGEAFVVLNPNEAQAAAERFRRYIEKPVWTQLKLRVEGMDVADVAPESIPDVTAERPVVVFGKYRGAPHGRFVLSGYSGAGRVEKVVEMAGMQARATHAPLRALWARKWVEILDDAAALAPSAALDEAVTGLGLSHNLLTRLTSFVAIDSQKVNHTGHSAQVTQPLPLPEGVSNMAVGGMAYGAGATTRAQAALPAAMPRKTEAASNEGFLGRMAKQAEGLFGARAMPAPAPAASPRRELEEADHRQYRRATPAESPAAPAGFAAVGDATLKESVGRARDEQKGKLAADQKDGDSAAAAGQRQSTVRVEVANAQLKVVVERVLAQLEGVTSGALLLDLEIGADGKFVAANILPGNAAPEWTTALLRKLGATGFKGIAAGKYRVRISVK